MPTILQWYHFRYYADFVCCPSRAAQVADALDAPSPNRLILRVLSVFSLQFSDLDGPIV